MGAAAPNPPHAIMKPSKPGAVPVFLHTAGFRINNVMARTDPHRDL